VNDERARGRVAGLVGVAALGFAVGDAAYDSYSVAKRESRFPVVSINKLPLVKRRVFDCCEASRVDVMATGNFDAEPGADLLVLLVRKLPAGSRYLCGQGAVPICNREM
jgi:hypothetical protein